MSSLHALNRPSCHRGQRGQRVGGERETLVHLPGAVEDEEPHACAEGLCETAVEKRGCVGVESCGRGVSKGERTRGVCALYRRTDLGRPWCRCRCGGVVVADGTSCGWCAPCSLAAHTPTGQPLCTHPGPPPNDGATESGWRRALGEGGVMAWVRAALWPCGTFMAELPGRRSCVRVGWCGRALPGWRAGGGLGCFPPRSIDSF